MPRVLSLVSALPVLAAHGLAPGPDGFDPADLVAAAAARGWTAHAERSPSRRGNALWRATVYAHLAAGNRPGITVTGTSGRGASEAEAIAVALASMLARHGRGG